MQAFVLVYRIGLVKAISEEMSNFDTDPLILFASVWHS